MPLRDTLDYQMLAMHLARLSEYGEACLTHANRALRRLSAAKILPDFLFLSEAIWHRRAYLEMHQENRGYVLQAALWTLRGYGVILWEAKDFWEYHRNRDLSPYAIPRFKAYRHCQPTERMMIGQQAYELFDQLSRKFEKNDQ